MGNHNFALTESERLAALADLAILDSGDEREFDAITRMVAAVLGVSSAAVSLIDRDRQWFKSRQGIDFRETPRDVAFCDQVVERRAPLVILDTLEDETFRTNPLVTGDPHIRFYAGAPLYLRSGHCIGSLCALDGAPRSHFPDANIVFLEELAQVVSELIEARRARYQAHIAAQVVASTTDAVFAANHAGKIVYWNEAAAHMFGRSAKAAIGRDVTEFIPDGLDQDYSPPCETASDEEPARAPAPSQELTGVRQDGATFPIELAPAPWGDEAHGGFASVVRDISARKKLRAERDSSRTFLKAVVANLPSMLYVKDSETQRYLLLNKKAADMIGRPAMHMIGKDDEELFPEQGDRYKQNDRDAISGGMPRQTETEFERDNGERVNIRTTRVLIDGPDRPGQYLLGLSEDVTEIRRSEADRWRLSRFDILTGLLNRASFLERVDQLINDAEPFALLNIDLDRFKSVNDQFGHVMGDEVLKLIGQRLSIIADEHSEIARIGGDEFVCLLTGDNLRSRALRISGNLIESIFAPISVGGITAHIGASIGVVLHPKDGDTIETLRQNSDLAMYRAKQEAKRQPCFFDDQMDAAERDRRTLETHLRAAVDTDEIDVAYQPIIEARSGDIIGFEALARWTQIDRGPVSPDLFIALAEDCGLIEQLGEQVLRKACRDACSWPASIKVAVNLSPRQFYSGHLVETILTVLEETGLPAERLQLEVTENLVIQNAHEAFAQLQQLRDIGIRISIDDFGIGYSSLSYFQRFTFDTVKIDKSFVSEIEGSQAAKAIVTAVVGLARQLSMAVVAEGVETAEQQKMLEDLGCTHLQGFLFSQPIAREEISHIVSASRKTAPSKVRASAIQRTAISRNLPMKSNPAPFDTPIAVSKR